jgi:hypothetical protein
MGLRLRNTNDHRIYSGAKAPLRLIRPGAVFDGVQSDLDLKGVVEVDEDAAVEAQDAADDVAKDAEKAAEKAAKAQAAADEAKAEAQIAAAEAEDLSAAVQVSDGIDAAHEAAAAAPAADGTTDGLDDLTKAKLKSIADANGIEYPTRITNDKLIAKIREAGVDPASYRMTAGKGAGGGAVTTASGGQKQGR